MIPDPNIPALADQTTQNSLQETDHNFLAEHAIITRDLLRVFGQKAAVNHLNLAVKRSEFHGFLGPNGAGKSTTIKMMVGLLRPTAGRVLVDGIDVWKNPLQARAIMGVLPEYLNLYERLTGKEFLVFAG
ncbi:MAG TPA: ATP-binding cassette domain-containing protein, partial [Ktedonobacteraceae bacterium]|nr:ATP-binding cassette domain-containing protein [Ktedonobacteraceae bacterium]